MIAVICFLAFSKFSKMTTYFFVMKVSYGLVGGEHWQLSHSLERRTELRINCRILKTNWSPPLILREQTETQGGEVLVKGTQ